MPTAMATAKGGTSSSRKRTEPSDRNNAAANHATIAIEARRRAPSRVSTAYNTTAAIRGAATATTSTRRGGADSGDAAIDSSRRYKMIPPTKVAKCGVRHSRRGNNMSNRPIQPANR